MNTLIKKFNELKLFLNVKNMSGGYTPNASFNSCTNLIELNTENITTIVGGPGNAATTNSGPLYNTKVKLLNMPNLTTTESYGFKGLSSVKIIIGSKYTTIGGQYAIVNVNNSSIIINATTPPSGQTLRRNNNNNTFIYVPDEVLDNYKAAASFANWVNYIKPKSQYSE